MQCILKKEITEEEIKQVIVNAVIEYITEKVNNKEISEDNKIEKFFNTSQVRVFLKNGNRFIITVNKSQISPLLKAMKETKKQITD